MDPEEENKKQKDVTEQEETVTVENEAISEATMKKFAALEEEIAKEKDGKLRALADAQNIKMRMQKEKEELLKYSQTVILLKILDVIDDFRNVIESYKGKDEDAWFSGVLMVYQKLLQMAEEAGVEVVMVKAGDTFDVTVHEAVGFVTVTEDNAMQKIAQVVAQGYRQKESGKIIKSAKVIVNKKDL